MLEIPQVVGVINNWGLGSKTCTNKIPNMGGINYISVDVVNKIPIKEDGTKKIYQTSRYKILNNDAYYVQHDCQNNQKLWVKLAVPFPQYGHD